MDQFGSSRLHTRFGSDIENLPDRFDTERGLYTHPIETCKMDYSAVTPVEQSVISGSFFNDSKTNNRY